MLGKSSHLARPTKVWENNSHSLASRRMRSRGYCYMHITWDGSYPTVQHRWSSIKSRKDITSFVPRNTCVSSSQGEVDIDKVDDLSPIKYRALILIWSASKFGYRRPYLLPCLFQRKFIKDRSSLLFRVATTGFRQECCSLRGVSRNKDKWGEQTSGDVPQDLKENQLRYL